MSFIAALRHTIPVFALVLGAQWPVHAKGLSHQHLDAQRARFLEAQGYLAEGQLADYKAAAHDLLDYPLYPYLVYDYLQQDLGAVSVDDVVRFMDEFPDTPLAERLRGDWLHRQAAKQNWASYLSVYRPTDDPSLQCHALWAAYQEGESIHHLHRDIAKLWTVGHSQSKACDRMFQAWYETGGINTSRATQRIYLAVTEGSYPLAKYLKRYLPDDERAWVDEWIRLRQRPSQLSSTTLPIGPTSHQGHIIVDLMKALADSDPEAAAEYWEKQPNPLPVSAEQSRQITHEIALHLALSASPQAEAWIVQLPEDAQSDQVKEWRIRAALQKEDWFGVLRGIAALNDELKNNPRWQYWHARALTEQGAESQAQAIYEALSDDRHYYGFLAAERLDRPLAFEHQQHVIEPQRLIAISNLPSMMRTYELMLLNRTLDARREWYHAIKQLPHEDRLAAARVAQRMGWHDLAIYTLSRTEGSDDLLLRFPLAYYKSIDEQSTINKLSPAWVFSIARQESHFRHDAKSPVGAIGLMQLMPATAKGVAAMLNLSPITTWDLVETDLNVTLGTAYLRDLLDDLDNNVVLATAAYNAGPNRVRQWLEGKVIPADIWIETIPYYETRHYLQNVLTYTSIYQHLLGEPSALLDLMRPIPAALPEAGESESSSRPT